MFWRILKISKSLYTQKEIKEFRDEQVKRQNGIDPITKEPFKETIAQDHCHFSQHCRGALNRNSNAFEGLVVNAYNRCLKWLTDVPLSVILRNLADYLEDDYSNNPYHIGWVKRVKTDFNKLSSSQQNKVLVALGSVEGTNPAKRKELFAKIVLDRSLGFDKISSVIDKVKEETY